MTKLEVSEFYFSLFMAFVLVCAFCWAIPLSIVKSYYKEKHVKVEMPEYTDPAFCVYTELQEKHVYDWQMNRYIMHCK